MIKVVFFASVREAVGAPSLEVEAMAGDTVATIIKRLGERGTRFQAALSAENLLVAVNQTMVEPGCAVRSGDEVAFFPPVTGG